MKIHDVSMVINSEITVYKNKPEQKPVFEMTANHENDGVRETRISMGMHTGTHIDAPLHMIADGDTTACYSPENFIGRGKVIDLSNLEEKISAVDLKGKGIKEGEYVFFKTKNSYDKGFNFDFIYVDKSAAQFLVEKKVKGVGIDSLGIERSQPEHPTHKILLNEKIMIIEGLRLKEVGSGEYQVIAVPLKIEGVEAAPARVLLIEEE